MLDGSRENQQALRSLLLASVPDLKSHGEARKDNYIRRLPDVSGLEITVGISQDVLDVRLVLKDGAMKLEEQATGLVQLLALGLGGNFVRYPAADRRATLCVRARYTDSNYASDWVARGIDGLLFIREQIA